MVAPSFRTLLMFWVASGERAYPAADPVAEYEAAPPVVLAGPEIPVPDLLTGLLDGLSRTSLPPIPMAWIWSKDAGSRLSPSRSSVSPPLTSWFWLSSNAFEAAIGCVWSKRFPRLTKSIPACCARSPELTYFRFWELRRLVSCKYWMLSLIWVFPRS